MHSGFSTLQRSAQELSHSLSLQFDTRHYRINANSAALIDALRAYFSGFESHAKDTDVSVYLFEDKPLNDAQANSGSKAIDWQDWRGEVGKTRLKEQYCDVADGRWIHKFKTGMVMFQHATEPLVIGPCAAHTSQVINFIINQHINYLQQQGGLICHASCVALDGVGIAIAASSGGGKSTTMLKLMDVPGSQFVSNDRLFLFSSKQGTVAAGVPKQPRVNPGTLLHNPRLINILPKDRQRALQQLCSAELWQCEEKYDVMVAQIYGADKQRLTTPLHHLILLNWQPGSQAPLQLNKVTLDERPDLIPAIAKSPGSFYQNAQGQFLSAAVIADDAAYQAKVRPLKVWEVCGGADFERLKTLVQTELLNKDK